MSKKTATDNEDDDLKTLEVEFEIEDGSAYLCTIYAYIPAIGDWIEVPESLSPVIAKKANNLVADYMEKQQDHINNELLNAAMSAVKDEYL
ncbi:MAG: hypothetical protein BWZ03_00330 [bacterium ADurb.BinA186]|nr:MAG: hypothetical protein BWZ03_00330 [bacterium ADurb.BinA186]